MCRPILDRTLELRRPFASQVLADWLHAEMEISEQEQFVLNSYQELLVLNREAWNEQE